MTKPLINLESTGLPMALVMALVVGSVTVGVTGSRIVTRLEALEDVADKRWTRQDAVVNALELKLRNPTLRVPDPRDSTREIQIGSTFE